MPYEIKHDTGGERALPDNYRPALADDVPEGRACGNCRFYNEAKVQGDEAFCEKWSEYVSGAYYCNAWQPHGEQAPDEATKYEDDERTGAVTEKENHMAIEFRQVKTEIRASADGHTFEGYAALFDSESDGLGFREVIRSGAFSKSVAAAKRGEWEVKALQDHRGELFLGSTKTGTLQVEEDERGLKVRVALNPEVSFASDLAAMLKRDGAAMGMSFGFSVPAKGESYNDGVRELTNVRLHEVSVLTGNEPAYPATIGLGAVRALSQRTGVEAERLTRAIDGLLHGEVDNASADVIDLAIRKVAPEVRSPWVAGGDDSLPVDETREWDGAAAADRVFTLAGFDTENVDTSLAARAFLVHDAGAPELRGSYKLGFADVVDNALVAIRAGLNAAASRLEQTDVPPAAIEAAREILDEYAPEDEGETLEDAARSVPLSVRERQLELLRKKI
jgi:HK97 family phage prohead protease